MLEAKFNEYLMKPTLGQLTKQIRTMELPCIPHIRLYCSEMFSYMVLPSQP